MCVHVDIFVFLGTLCSVFKIIVGVGRVLGISDSPAIGAYITLSKGGTGGSKLFLPLPFFAWFFRKCLDKYGPKGVGGVVAGAVGSLPLYIYYIHNIHDR